MGTVPVWLEPLSGSGEIHKLLSSADGSDTNMGPPPELLDVNTSLAGVDGIAIGNVSGMVKPIAKIHNGSLLVRLAVA